MPKKYYINYSKIIKGGATSLPDSIESAISEAVEGEGVAVPNPEAGVLVSAKLSNMPKLCLGLLDHYGKLNEILPRAIDLGYRHFDGANAYENPEYLGNLRRIFDEKINSKRNEFWITWKGDNIKEDEVEAKF